MRTGSIARRTAESEPRVRRGYFESRHGQLHVYTAMPAGGGFEEGTALLCLHAGPTSGGTFRGFLAAMGRDRSVYAPDLPGNGESDAPPARPSIADYATAVGDFLETMRIRQIDVLGHHTSALIAAELAIERPQQIRRLVMVGVPVLTEAERTSFSVAPWPLAPAEDGSHLVPEWRRTLETRGSAVPLEIVARSFAEKLRNGPTASWGMSAAAQYRCAERLPRITQPVLVLRPRDDLWEATWRARELLPEARIVDLPEHGQALFEAAPQAVVGAVKDFLSSQSA
jgi:pimeloyl-ACP methyl ester carboxylesterase